MKADVGAIKALRNKTNASLSDVRAALEASKGDESKALAWLRERGAAIAQTREGRATGQGRVEAYVHHDARVAVLVEINCETDFVARTPEFIQFCRDVAMQVAAMNPRYVREGDAPEGGDAAGAGLLEQPFIKDAGLTVGGLLQGLVAKTGEHIVIRRFARFALGEAAD